MNDIPLDQALPLYLDMLKEGDASLRAKAAEKLGHLCSPPDLTVAGLNFVRDSSVNDKDEVGPERRGSVVDALIPMLDDSDPAVRLEAAAALGRIGPASRKAVPTLIKRLTDPDTDVRQTTIEYLGWIGDSAAEAVPVLITLLRDEDRYLRRSVMETLGRIGPADGEVVPALIGRLRDPEDEGAAMSALGAVGLSASPAVPILMDIVNEGVRQCVKSQKGQGAVFSSNEIDNEQRRRSALEALAGIGEGARDAVPDLAALIDKDDVLTDDILPVLAKIGGQGILELTRFMDHGDTRRRIRIIVLLGEISGRDASVIPALSRALRDPDYEVRHAAAQAFWDTGPAAVSAVPDLSRLLRERDSGTRDAAACALANLGRAAAPAIPALLESARYPCSCFNDVPTALANIGEPAIPHLIQAFTDPLLRRRMVPILDSIGSLSIPPLMAALRDPNSDIREGSAEVLGNIGDTTSRLYTLDESDILPILSSEARDAVPALIHALKDESAFVREAAAEALRKIGPEAGPAVPALKELLADDDSGVRAVALHTIREIAPEDPERAATAIRLLKDKSENVRWEAICAIRTADLENADVRATVISSLKDGHDPIRRRAPGLLKEMPSADPDAINALFAALKDPDPWVRQDVISALERFAMERPETVPALTGMLKDPYPGVRKAAREVLENIRKSQPPH